MSCAPAQPIQARDKVVLPGEALRGHSTFPGAAHSDMTATMLATIGVGFLALWIVGFILWLVLFIR